MSDHKIHRLGSTFALLSGDSDARAVEHEDEQERMRQLGLMP